MIILGIDPGLATVGYGVIQAVHGNFSVVDYGVVSTPPKITLPERLMLVEDGVAELIETYKPDNNFAYGKQSAWRRSVRVYAQPDKASHNGLWRRG